MIYAGHRPTITVGIVNIQKAMRGKDLGHKESVQHLARKPVENFHFEDRRGVR
jgi:hypothetical protein